MKKFTTNPNKLLMALGAVTLVSVNANAALSIDTTQIMTDIQTAGVSGLAIALSVAGIAIGVMLVRKLIKA